MLNEPNTNIFTSIYSEPYPIGDLGETGYSVLRAIDFQDEIFTPYKQAHVHDFALIWHRYINQKLPKIAETIYAEGLFPPVRFLGMRDSSISILISEKFRKTCGNTEFKNYAIKLDTLCHKIISEKAEVHIGTFDRAPEWPQHPFNLAGITPADEYRSSIFLRNIDALWQLEPKPFPPTPTQELSHIK